MIDADAQRVPAPYIAIEDERDGGTVTTIVDETEMMSNWISSDVAVDVEVVR